MTETRWWVLSPWTAIAVESADPARTLYLFADSDVYGVLRLAAGWELEAEGWYVVQPVD